MRSIAGSARRRAPPRRRSGKCKAPRIRSRSALPADLIPTRDRASGSFRRRCVRRLPAGNRGRPLAVVDAQLQRERRPTAHRGPAHDRAAGGGEVDPARSFATRGVERCTAMSQFMCSLGNRARLRSAPRLRRARKNRALLRKLWLEFLTTSSRRQPLTASWRSAMRAMNLSRGSFGVLVCVGSRARSRPTSSRESGRRLTGTRCSHASGPPPIGRRPAARDTRETGVERPAARRSVWAERGPDRMRCGCLPSVSRKRS